MALGDNADMVARIKRALPPSWFASDSTPVLDIVISGFAAPLTWAYSLYAYTVAQMRLSTASGVWIDRICYDFLGTRLFRQGQNDALFKVAVKAEILRARQTRVAIVKAVSDLTGRQASIVEPWNPADCGGYGYAMGYGCAGAYGSLALPNQIFVTAVRPIGLGVPNVGGYGAGAIGYGVAGEYLSDNQIYKSQIFGPVTDAAIYAAIDHTLAAGMTAWTFITNFMQNSLTVDLTADNTAFTADNATITAWTFITKSMPKNPPDTRAVYLTDDNAVLTADNATIKADAL